MLLFSKNFLNRFFNYFHIFRYISSQSKILIFKENILQALLAGLIFLRLSDKKRIFPKIFFINILDSPNYKRGLLKLISLRIFQIDNNGFLNVFFFQNFPISNRAFFKGFVFQELSYKLFKIFFSGTFPTMNVDFSRNFQTMNLNFLNVLLKIFPLIIVNFLNIFFKVFPSYIRGLFSYTWTF